MKFKDVFYSKEERFSVGVEEESGRYYVSIPVSNTFVDYEEYYEIDKTSFDRYQVDISAAKHFVNKCRNREVDDLLIIKPGKDRGVPI